MLQVEAIYGRIVPLASSLAHQTQAGKTIAKILSLALLLTVYPVIYLFMWIDRRLSWNPFVRFPRTTQEAIARPQLLFRKIAPRILPVDSKFVDFKALGGSKHEPGKDKALCRGIYTYLDGVEKTQKSIDIFIKMPTARGHKASFRALMAVFCVRNKEVDFYETIMPGLGHDLLPVPRGIYAEWNRFFDRSVIVTWTMNTERMRSIADWQGVSVCQARRLITTAARLHAKTWGGNAPCLQWIQERVSTEWLDGAVHMIAQGPGRKSLIGHEYVMLVWEGIKKRCLRDPVCLSHGDCRPGNMLYEVGDISVTLTDWEAVSITPFMWDCCYTIHLGLSVADRRAHERDLIKDYLACLNSLGVQDVPRFDEAYRLYKLMAIVIKYFGWILGYIGGVGEKQGNSDDDMIAWGERLVEGAMDATRDVAWFAKEIGVEVSHIEHQRRDFMAEQKSIEDLKKKQKK